MKTPRQIARERGLKFYYTGVPCKRGHLSVRRVATGGCDSCVLRIALEYYYENREKVIANKKADRAYRRKVFKEERENRK